MRLIDADSLRKQIDDCKYFYSSFEKMTVAEFLTIVHELIDNAPAIHTEDCEGCPYCPNSNSGIPIGVE